jgi:polysaccharide deacetylase 2 family uncharacterized protein YibQ
MAKKSIFKNKKITIIVLIFVLLSVGIGAFVGGYYVAKSTIKPQVIIKEDKKAKEALEALQKLVDENIKAQKPQPNPKSKKEITKKIINSEAIDYKENAKKENVEEVQKQIVFSHKPKLVIIMDDMSFYYQVKALKNLGIKITPSFFPSSHIHPNTPKYAKEFKHYMVHFPMQATNPNFKEEPNTLHISNKYSVVFNRVIYIKSEFPNVKFVNNHTGSKFTSNIKAMDRLYKALQKEGLIFVDSKTTPYSKAKIMAKKYHQLLLSRDVFLDNKADVKYIQNQLKQAIRIAKKRGYAIAICHPHPKTFEALAKSKKLLKNVEVVYIDELYNQLSKL